MATDRALHLGGVRRDEQMETNVSGFMRQAEAVGGSNGPNRLSGNALSRKPLTFGRIGPGGLPAGPAVRRKGHWVRACIGSAGLPSRRAGVIMPICRPPGNGLFRQSRRKLRWH